MWGLDEYHFFPFLWGAAQLRGHDLVRPGSVSNDEVLEVYAHDYLYLDAVQFVRKVKKGPLHETSPLLYDITAVPNWVKVRCTPTRVSSWTRQDCTASMDPYPISMTQQEV